MQSVEGMKVICHELTQAADPESTILEELIKEADRLVSCLAVMVNIILFSLLVCFFLLLILFVGMDILGPQNLQF